MFQMLVYHINVLKIIIIENIHYLKLMCQIPFGYGSSCFVLIFIPSNEQLPLVCRILSSHRI